MIERLIYKYDEGSDNIWISGLQERDYYFIVGASKLNGKYHIVISKMAKSGDIEWSKIYGGDNNYEARTILKVSGGYLLGGNAHGIATKSGGIGWKGYILKIDEHGNKIDERVYKIGENDAIYSLTEIDGYIFCLGETTIKNKRYVFVMKINKALDIISIWKYGGYEEVFAGGLSEKIMAFSFKINNQWYGKIIKFGKGFYTLWERDIKDFLIYSVNRYLNNILLCGEKNSKAYILIIDDDGEVKYEKEFEEGTFTDVAIFNGNIALCGDIKNKPMFFILDKNLEIVDKYSPLKMQGWFEKTIATGKNNALLLGYFSDNKIAVCVLLAVKNGEWQT